MHHHYIAQISCLDSVYLTCSFNVVKARDDLTKSESILSSIGILRSLYFSSSWTSQRHAFYGLDISLSLHNKDEGFSEY